MVRLARARLLARQQPIEVAVEARETAQVLQLIAVDVAHHAEPQAAAAQLGEGLGNAVAQPEVTAVEMPLRLAIVLEMIGVGLDAELAQHLDDRLAEHVLVQEEFPLEVSAEHAAQSRPIRSM